MGALAAMIVPSLVSGAVSGGMGLIGQNNADTGGSSNTMPWWLQMARGFLSSAEQKRVMEEYQRRSDEQRAEALSVAGTIGPETLSAYDAASRSAEAELQGLRKRQMVGAEDLIGQTEQAREEFLKTFGRRGEALMSDWDKTQAAYGTDLANFLGGLGGQSSDILQGYQDRYAKAEADLAGYGEQQKADINRGFEQMQAATAQDMINRGLVSSTAAANEIMSTEERRSAEQRRLAEDLARNRINVLGGMSGEQLAAQERLGAQSAGFQFGGMNTLANMSQNALAQQAALNASEAAYDAAMRGDILSANQYLQQVDAATSGNLAGFYGNMASNRANLIGQGSNAVLNTIMGWENVPPPQNQLPFMFGQNAASVPAASSMWPSFMANMAPGMGQAAGVGMYNALNQQPTFAPSASYQAMPPNTSWSGVESWEPVVPSTTPAEYWNWINPWETA